MAQGFAAETGHVLTFVRNVEEALLDVRDEDSDGFIGLEHLLLLASQFGQAEQVTACPGYSCLIILATLLITFYFTELAVKKYILYIYQNHVLINKTNINWHVL